MNENELGVFKAHARFRAVMIDFMASESDLVSMLGQLGPATMKFFGCDVVGYDCAEDGAERWCLDGKGPVACARCRKCAFLDVDNPKFRREGVYQSADIAPGEFNQPEFCPIKSVITSSIKVGTRHWGVVSLMKTEPHGFTEAGHENMALLAKTVAVIKRREEADKAKSLFFSTVSHDIRTPLNAIIGYSQLLKSGIANETERNAALGNVINCGNMLLDLINDVLDISKLEAGSMAIVPRPVNVGDLVQEIAAAFRHEIEAKELALRVEVGWMPILLVDPQRLRQILFNLVGNAVKFTSAGSISIHVAYSDGELTLDVADTGKGIPPEGLTKLMKPFAQIDSGAGKGEGTGLGLAICHGLAKRMGGGITVTSEVGKGSVFRVLLRGVHPAEPGALFESRNAAPVVPAANRDGNVLVVDDSRVNRSVLRALLKRFGFNHVDEAENGAEAFVMLHQKRYELVLTDLWMPEMDGEDFVRCVRGDLSLANLPIYAVTADVESQKRDASALFTGMILKPVTFEKLSEILK